MNRKGFAQQIILLFIILAVLIGIMVCFWFWSMIAPTTTAIISDLSGDVINAAANTSDGNLSNAANTTFSSIRNTVNNFEWITYALMASIVFGFLILCFFVRGYPFLIFFWIIGIIVMCIVSLFLSDAYQSTITNNDYYSTATQSWATSHYIMTNLPMIFVAIGILGGIILFVLVSREPSAEVTGI